MKILTIAFARIPTEVYVFAAVLIVPSIIVGLLRLRYRTVCLFAILVPITAHIIVTRHEGKPFIDTQGDLFTTVAGNILGLALGVIIMSLIVGTIWWTPGALWRRWSIGRKIKAMIDGLNEAMRRLLVGMTHYWPLLVVLALLAIIAGVVLWIIDPWRSSRSVF